MAATPDQRTWLLSGVDTAIPTTAFNDVNAGGPALRLYPTVAAAAEVVSSETDDAAAGIGARQILLEGYDGSGGYQTELVTMDGTTAVAGTKTWLGVPRATVVSAGSAGINQGNITVTIPSATADAAQCWQIDDPAGSPVYVDETAEFNSAAAGDVNPWPPAGEAIGDQFAIGFADKFGTLSIDVGTVGTDGTLTWKYWNGSAWVALEGVTDSTTGFTASGVNTVIWTVPPDWKKSIINGSASLYFVVAEVLTLYTIDPILDTGDIVGTEQCRIPSGFYAGQSRQTDIKIPAGHVGTVVAWGASHSDTTNHAEVAVFAKRPTESAFVPITDIVRLGDTVHSEELVDDSSSIEPDPGLSLPPGTEVSLRALSFTAASVVAGWIKIQIRKKRESNLTRYGQ